MADEPKPESVTLSECHWCASVTINAQSDTCACGGEFYPVSKVVEAGARIMSAWLEDVQS